MLVYLISSKDEEERLSHILDLKNSFNGLVSIDAIYPNKTHVPFLDSIKSISKIRAGNTLSDGALGCLLSHRNTWAIFINQANSENCIIIESDSYIVDIEKLSFYYQEVKDRFDLFFFGAFDGRMKLFKSKTNNIGSYQIGEPYINSLYCTYGYMINKNAARYLLQATSKFDYPVDYWKRRLKNTNLKIGGIVPNLITTKSSFKSTISKKQSSLSSKLFNFIVDLKNSLITQFN